MKLDMIDGKCHSYLDTISEEECCVVILTQYSTSCPLENLLITVYLEFGILFIITFSAILEACYKKAVVIN